MAVRGAWRRRRPVVIVAHEEAEAGLRSSGLSGPALDHHVPGQAPVIIETLGMGDIPGWLFPPFQRAFGAVRLAPCGAFEFDGPAVRARLDAGPGLGYELIRRFVALAANRARAARSRLLGLRVPSEA